MSVSVSCTARLCATHERQTLSIIATWRKFMQLCCSLAVLLTAASRCPAVSSVTWLVHLQVPEHGAVIAWLQTQQFEYLWAGGMMYT